MDSKLNKIYSFLNANRQYNQFIQIEDYKSAMLPYDNTFKKVYSLLHATLNTQSQLNLDKAATFFQNIYESNDNLDSFSNFLKTIGADSRTPFNFKHLFSLLEKQKSWGPKTAALFTKAIYHTHIGYAKELHFWDDVPKDIESNDELYLPVDSVILFIFKSLEIPCNNTFLGINEYIKQNAPLTDFDIWDDLWFWGFITQKGNNGKRELAFNEAKYWNLLNSSKDLRIIEEIRILAIDFITLLKHK